MTEWNVFTGAELGKIADQVWGENRYTPGIGPMEVVCPKCGATATVWADETIGRRPQRFRSSCRTCSTRGSGNASSHTMRRFESEEVNAILRRHRQDGLETYCPECQTPLKVEELEISGSSNDYFMLRCYRCGSHGQGAWPPEEG